MDKLPTPLLESIFKYLHYEQKRECMLVCRLWTQILLAGLDVETISMADKDKYHAFLKSLQGAGSICKRLTLIGNQNLPETAKTFPKIEFVAFTYDDGVESAEEAEVDEYTNEEALQISTWHQHLKTIVDFQHSNKNYKLLSTGRFEKLTTLELRRGDYNFESCEKLIECLKHTPYLKTLKMEQFNFVYSNLNSLHKNATHLQTLVLDNCCPTGPHISPTETPAYSMKRLDIIGINDYWEREEGFCRFVLAKYPNLQHLTLPRSKFISLWKKNIPLMIRHYPLIDLNMPTAFDVPNIVSELKEHALTTLKQLALALGCNKDLFINIIELTRFSNIESLSLADAPAIDFTVFKKLDRLKSLELKFSVRIFYGKNPREEWIMEADLNTIMKELPESLETLNLFLIKLSLISKNDRANKKWYHSKLKRLEIHDSDIVDDLSNYLSKCYFPNLNTLLLHYNVMLHPLLLPDQCFSFVSIQAACPYFKVTVGKQNSYMFKEYNNYHISYLKDYFHIHDHPMYCAASKCHEIEDEYFYIQCKSVHTLLFNNYIILT